MTLVKPNTQITVPYSNRNAYYFVPRATQHYTKSITSLNIFTDRPFKNIFKNLRASLVNSSLLTRLIIRGRGPRTTNINISTTKNTKSLNRFMKTVQIQTSKLKKAIRKSIKFTFIQKVRDRERTFFRRIDIASINTTKISKALFKIVRSNLINSNRINKTKTTNIKANKINSNKINKQKQWYPKIDEINSNRINKQKQWYPKIDNIQRISFTKTKYVILRAVKVLMARLPKQKNTTIKINTIFSTKFNKKAFKKPIATQVVSATITRATSRRRGITSGITYTIGSTRIQTLHRKAIAIITNAFRPNKSIKKSISASNTNILSVARGNIPWKFIFKIITKIVSFKDQTIEIPGYAIPDPDLRDPNMLDSSTPSVEGTIYGNPDDDSFIE